MVRKLKAVDFFGALLALGGTIVLVMGLTWGGGQCPWESAAVIVSLVVGFAVSVAFVLWQWKGPRYPLVPRKSIAVGAAAHADPCPSAHLQEAYRERRLPDHGHQRMELPGPDLLYSILLSGCVRGKN